jgi:translation initiation factor RLI1
LSLCVQTVLTIQTSEHLSSESKRVGNWPGGYVESVPLHHGVIVNEFRLREFSSWLDIEQRCILARLAKRFAKDPVLV